MISSPSDNSMEFLAGETRLRLGIPDDLRIDAIDLLRRAKLAGIINDFRPVARDELPLDQARWEAETRSVAIREAVYNAALEGDVNAAFTIVHELGHAVMNHATRNRKPGGSAQFGRRVEQDEFDADWFARSLMVPEAIAQHHDVSSAQSLRSLFGLPASQASVRSEELARRKRLRSGTPRLLPAYDALAPTSDREVEEEYERYINSWAHAPDD